jgi:hypothetical protein
MESESNPTSTDKECDAGRPHHSLYEFDVSIRMGQGDQADIAVLYNGSKKGGDSSWRLAPSLIATCIEDHLIETGVRPVRSKGRPSRVLFEDYSSGANTYPFHWIYRLFGSKT